MTRMNFVIPTTIVSLAVVATCSCVVACHKRFVSDVSKTTLLSKVITIKEHHSHRIALTTALSTSVTTNFAESHSTGILKGTATTALRNGFDQMNKQIAPATIAEKYANNMFSSGDMKGAEKSCKSAIAAYKSYSDSMGGMDLSNGAHHLLAKIYLRQNRNAEALQQLSGIGRNYYSSMPPGLDAALALVRLGRFEEARQMYAPNGVHRFWAGYKKPVDPADLPGIDTSAHLEASILLSHGIEYSGEEENAVFEYLAAERVSPGSAFVNYRLGSSLRFLQRFDEAVKPLRFAFTHAHGPLKTVAESELVDSQFGRRCMRQRAETLRLHPEMADWLQHRNAPNP